MIFVCEECGKQCERSYMDEYIYKKPIWDSKGHYKQTIYFCGWNCMRKWERKKEKKQWKKG